MAPQLKNALTFNLAIGETAIIPHNLNNGQRDLIPDIVFVPSADLAVSADDQAVTLRNLSGVQLAGAVLVESWHSIERAFGDAAVTALAPQPYIVVSAEGGNQPPQPPFENAEIEIYARLTGSDTTGDGSLAHPYATFQRAIRDVPSIVPAGTIYKVDITGIGTETLPHQYEFPTFIGSEGIGNFDFAEEYFYYYGTVNVVADPEPATVAGLTTISLADVGAVAGVGDSFVAAAGIVTLTDAAGAFVPGMVGSLIKVSGATNTDNNGVFTIASVVGPTQITYANAAGVTEAYTGAYTVYTNITIPTPSTGLLKISVPGANWAGPPMPGARGELVGKFLISSGAPTEHCVIWQNFTNEIYLTSKTLPTFPLSIKQCSAGFEAAKTPADLHRAAVNINNTQISLGGIQIRVKDPVLDQPFGGWSLQIAGNTPPTSIQLCDIQGAGFEGVSWVRSRQNYLKDSLFMMAPLASTQTFFDGSIEVAPALMPARITMWGARGLDSMFKQCVLKATTPLHFRDLFDNFRSGVVGILEVSNTQILDTIQEFPPADYAGNDGIYWTGGRLYLTNVDISRSAPGAGGTALTVNGNGAWVELTNVTGDNYANGCAVQDGGLVVLRDTVTLTGTSDQLIVGVTIGLFWPASNYPAPLSNITDWGTALGQGARVYRKS